MNDNSRKFSNIIFQLIAIVFFLIASNLILKTLDKPIIKISKQESAINLNASIIDSFSLGYRRFITSLFWISTILESDHEHYKNKDANSWMFLRFNLIATLDPKFYENYVFGGQYLSIIKDDDIGAKIILDKGLNFFSNDYNLLLIASFHYYFELQQHKEAIKIYKRLITFPQVPRHIISFYSKMISQESVTEEVFAILKELYEKNKHITFLKNRYHDNLYAIRAELDLFCLNTKKNNCRSNDFSGFPYLFKDGKFQAQKKWVPFRVTK